MNENRTHLRVFNPDATGSSDDGRRDQPVESAPDTTPNMVGKLVTPPNTGSAADLQVVLTAWHSATERLQKTHEVLCGEVRRLTQELEAKNRELTRKNRLADLGQMASHVAHEVRNSLAPVTLYLSLLRRRLREDGESLRVVDKLEAGFTALEATVHDMLAFTADRQPAWRRFSLYELVSEVCESLGPQFVSHEVATTIDVPRQLAVWGDRDMLRRALVNLALNAIDVMPQGGEVCITGYERSGGFELEVADSGPGVTDDVAARIFEPFFTTKSDGAGLGLAIVYRVAEAHGGEVRLANCPEGGAAFTIRIPRRAQQEAA
jgi:signal transduction histidine kinase